MTLKLGQSHSTLKSPKVTHHQPWPLSLQDSPRCELGINCPLVQIWSLSYRLQGLPGEDYVHTTVFFTANFVVSFTKIWLDGEALFLGGNVYSELHKNVTLHQTSVRYCSDVSRTENRSCIAMCRIHLCHEFGDSQESYAEYTSWYEHPIGLVAGSKQFLASGLFLQPLVQLSIAKWRVPSKLL